MSQQAHPRMRPGQQARPGDVTGRKREQLAAEHADEVKAREGELAMISAEKQRSANEDVIDPFTKETIKPDGSVVRTDEDEDDEPRLLNTQSSMQIEEMPELRPQLGPNGQPISVQRDPMEKVEIRMACDLEDVTLGHGNTFTFKQDHKYRVPRWVAQHFEDKGVLWGT